MNPGHFMLCSYAYLGMAASIINNSNSISNTDRLLKRLDKAEALYIIKINSSGYKTALIKRERKAKKLRELQCL